jgi:sec-independent protein translocase protein TatC
VWKYLRAGRAAAAEMPFLEHLEELRWRILWSLIALVAFTVAGFFLVKTFNVLSLLILPVQPFLNGSHLAYLSPTDPFMLTLQLALAVGLILSSPVIVYQIWAFVSPALLSSEKRAIVPALYLGLVLFAAGVSMAYFIVLPLSLRFMMSFETEALMPMLTANAYLGFVIKLLLAFGIMFEMPVVMLILSLLGIVHSRTLASGRRYALVIITIAASMITPADLLSTLLLMGPLLVLYEASIVMAKFVERRRQRIAAAEALAEAQ